MEEGIEPLSGLLSKYKAVRFTRLPIEEGIEPVNWL